MLRERDLRIVPSDKESRNNRAHKNNFSQCIGGSNIIVRVFEFTFTVGNSQQVGAFFKDLYSFQLSSIKNYDLIILRYLFMLVTRKIKLMSKLGLLAF